MKLLLLSVVLSLCTIGRADRVVVKTPYGSVSGTRDQNAFAFRGIPFAAPPVGKLRFMDPVDPQPWSGVRDASQFGAGCIADCDLPDLKVMCPQTVSEDCLFLNVFTPQLNDSTKLPVLIFFHGGGFFQGAGGVPMYDGAYLAATQKIVVVTTNYRLNVFGALYTGTVQSNYHIKDQRQSMKWVQKCIGSFGGDPGHVTIFGQSAGAMSVLVHMVAPKSWPYFHGAVSLSSAPVLETHYPDVQIQLGSQILDQLGCPHGGIPEIDCLQSRSSEDIFAAANASRFPFVPTHLFRNFIKWAPTVDGEEIPMDPYVAFSNGDFKKVPTYLGSVANETTPFIYMASHKPMSTLELDAIIALAWGLKNAEGIVHHYPKPYCPKDDCRMGAVQPTTDYLFYCALRNMSAAAAAVNPDTYMYFYDYYSELYLLYNRTMPYCDYVICHAADLLFYFAPFLGAPNVSWDFTPSPQDLKVVTFMTTALGNFVRTGNPNPLPGGIVWEKFSSVASTNNLMNLSTSPSMIRGYRNEFCNFWDTVGYTGFV